MLCEGIVVVIFTCQVRVVSKHQGLAASMEDAVLEWQIFEVIFIFIPVR